MSDGDALLAAILAQPDEDTPRLVYADWCDENDQPERAEFIRVQIELARWEAAEPPECRDPAYRAGFRLAQHNEWRILAALLGRNATCRCAACLSKRARELWEANWSKWARAIDRYNACARLDGCGLSYVQYGPDRTRADFISSQHRRGFLDLVEVAADFWVAHGDAIRSKHPVTRVRLTTWPMIEHGRKGRARLVGDAKWFTGREMMNQLARNINKVMNPFVAIRDEYVLLQLRFPRIEFDLSLDIPVTNAGLYEPASTPQGSVPTNSGN